MSLKFKIIDELKLVYVLGEGRLTFKQLVAHLNELSNHPQYQPPMLKIIDYRNLTQIALTSDESEEFARIKCELGGPFMKEKCAFIVSSDLAFGIGRQYQAFLNENQMETRIFREIEKAKQWLGLEIPDGHLVIA